MKVFRLGRTGLRVSVIGVGTWQLGGERGRRFTQPEVDRLLGCARELGVNLVDTAECYGDYLAEAVIGGAIRQQRGDRVVATKCGHRFHPEAVQHGSGSPARLRTDHWTPTEVVAQLEASLPALPPTTWTSTRSIPAPTRLSRTTGIGAEDRTEVRVADMAWSDSEVVA
jgi:aryl-alcohol dehydrogenase-like predicted oxidoreductase